jgi:PAS domain S-box-containing protein
MKRGAFLGVGVPAGIAALGLLTALATYDQIHRNETNFRSAAAEDLAVLASLLGEHLQRGAYVAASHTVDQWATRNKGIVSAHVTARNGNVIAHFERPDFQGPSLALTTTVPYSYQGEARVTLVRELGSLESARNRVVAEVVGIYMLVVAFVLVLVRGLQIYRIEAQRLQREIVRRQTLALERARAERANLQLVSLVRHAQEFISIADLDGVVTFVNEFGRRLCGIGPDASLGDRRIKDFVHPRDHERLLREAIPAVATSGHWSGRIDFQHHGGGTPVPMLVEAFRIDDIDGRPLNFATVSRDITDLMQADARVRRLNSIYRTLSHTNQAIVRATSPTDLLERVCQIAVEHGGFALCWVGLLDKDGLLPVVASAGPARAYLDGIRVTADERVPEGRGPSGEALRSGAHVVVNNSRASEGMRPWWDRAAKFGIESSAAFPLHSGGRVVGALSVYSTVSDGFGEPEASLLDNMAADISFGLETLHRSAALDRSLEQIRDVEAAVRVGALRLQLPQWSLWWSEGTPAILGLPAATVAERASLETALGPELMSIMSAALAQSVESGRPVDIDLPVGVRQQTDSWIRLSGVPRQRDDGTSEISCTLQDISERKRLELQVSQAADIERRRLASELHDNLGQILFGLSLLLASIIKEARTTGSPLASKIEHTTAALNQAMQVCRTLAHGVAPVLEGGLSAALSELAEGLAATGVECIVTNSEIASVMVTGARAVELFRIVQEAINNALRHGRCRRIEVSLTVRGSSLEVSIHDDGAGVDLSAPGGGQGIGLQTMRYRAARAGGTLEMRSSPGHGAIVHVRVPLLAEDTARAEANSGP